MSDHAQTQLLLLPGLVTDGRLWRQQAEALADVVRPRVADLTGSPTIKDLAHDVLQQAGPEPFALAGLSMGGYVALEIMRQAPQQVRALALLDTSARPDTEEAMQKRRGQMQRSIADYGGVVEDMLPKMLSAEALADPLLAGRFRDMALEAGPEVYRRQQEAIMSRPDSRPDLPAIRCPTLILCGRDDTLTPVEVHEEMASLIPESRLTVIEQCAHLSPLNQPQAVSDALRAWLFRALCH